MSSTATDVVATVWWKHPIGVYVLFEFPVHPYWEDGMQYAEETGPDELVPLAVALGPGAGEDDSVVPDKSQSSRIAADFCHWCKFAPVGDTDYFWLDAIPAAQVRAME